jgi:hypothetical protein
MWLKLIGIIPVEALCLIQKAVEDVTAIDYMKHCDGGENTCKSKDLSTNQFDLSTCCIHINITNGENRSEMYMT